jgi:acyl-CoA thioester hydrolase
VVAEVSCRYFAEVGYPDPVDVGVAAEKVGSSSVVYRVGLFQGEGEEAAAEGRFVHVYVDNAGVKAGGNTGGARPVVPMPAEIRAAVEPLLRR